MRRFIALTLAALLLAELFAAPWLFEGWVGCGWLGGAGMLAVVTRLKALGGLLWMVCCATVALASGFSWLPEALANAMELGYAWGLVGFVPFLIWDAIRLAVPFWLAARVTACPTAAWLPAGLAAVSLEVALSSVFPWRFGYSQVAWPWTIQGVDLCGPGWATFMFFAYCGAIVLLGQWACKAVAARSVVGLPYALGRSPLVWLCVVNLLYSAASMAYWQQQMNEARSINVALIQVEPGDKSSPTRMRELTQTVSKQVDLACWPESSGGTYEMTLDRLTDRPRVLALSRDPQRGLRPWEHPDCDLLLGCLTYRGDQDHPDELYQSAILLDKHERIIARYFKRYLMPFGEYVPGEGWVPGVQRLFNLPEVFSAGQDATVLSTDTGARLGVMMCYEDMVPEAARTLTQHSANVLVSLVNASALHNPRTLIQHRWLAQLRAVECRRNFLRCAATGETCVISPLGIVKARLPLQTPGVLTVRIALLPGQTGYCRFGWTFPAWCFLALGWYAWSHRSTAQQVGRRGIALRKNS